LNTRPTEESQQALFEIAAKIKAAEPWKRLADTDIITVRFPDRAEPVYFSVLGQQRECYGIAVYPSYNALLGLLKLATWKDVPFSVLITYQSSLVCYYGNRDDLSAEDRKVIRELGLQFRGRNNWIYFRSKQPGYLEWYLNAEECALMTQSLERFFEAYQALAGGLSVAFDKFETLIWEYSQEQGKWSGRAEKMPSIPEEICKITITGSDRLKKIHSMPPTGQTLECDVRHALIPIQENKGERPTLPLMSVLADSKTGMILACKIIEGEKPFSVLFDQISSYIDEIGKPSRLIVRDHRMVGAVQDICRKTGIRLKVNEHLPAIDKFLEGIVKISEDASQE
jgi:hypothetical protein